MYTTVQDQKGNLEVLVHLDVDCRDRKAIRASEATDHQDHLADEVRLVMHDSNNVSRILYLLCV